MQPVIEKPALSTDPRGLVAQLQAVLQQHGYAINVSGADIVANAAAIATNTTNIATNTTNIATNASAITALQALFAAPAFTAPTLLNSWVNFGGVYSNAGYYKDPLGRVHLRGLVKNGTIPADIFVLPTGFRPSGSLLFRTYSDNGAADVLAVVNIEADGSVVALRGNNAAWGLNGISFTAA